MYRFSFFFFFKQKTPYEMPISDWISDVCSSDPRPGLNPLARGPRRTGASDEQHEQMVRQRRIATLISLIEMALGGKALTAPEHACIHLALERAISATHDHPTLRSVYAEVIRIAGGDTDDPDLIPAASGPRYVQIGRASWRERVGQYV